MDITQAGNGNISTVGSVVMQDTVMNGVTKAGILTGFASNSTPVAGQTLVLDNVNFIDTPVAVAYPNLTVIVAGNQRIKSYVQGRAYTVFDAEQPYQNEMCFQPTVNASRIQKLVDPPPKPVSLLDQNGKFFERAKPQYQDIPVSRFVSIMNFGCPNDGLQDATDCVQRYLNSITTNQIAFIDHGAYLIRDTIEVPIQIKMVGEAWSYFMIDGTSAIFQDVNNPQPAFRVGQPGQKGAVEMSEIMFQTVGPAPGAILMEWNLGQTSQGSNCMSFTTYIYH